MRVWRLSASNISVFLSCPYRYKLQYNDRVPNLEVPNEYAPPGSAFHSTAERYFSKYPNPPLDINKFLEILAEEFPKNGCSSSKYGDMCNVVREWAKRFNFPKKILALEQKVEIDLPNGVPILSYLDIIEEIDEDTIRVRDWKTGQIYSDDDLDDNIQAPLYILGAKQLYPDKRVEFIFDFIKYNEVQYPYDNNQMRTFVKWLKGIYQAILSMDEKDAKPRLGSCRFCSYSDKCPTMDKARKGGFQISPQTSESLDNLIEYQYNISNAVKSLDDEKARLKGLIMDKMDEETYEAGDYKAKMVRSKRTEYDTKTVINAFRGTKYFNDIITIDKKKVKEHLDSLPEHKKAEIEDSEKSKYQNPYVRISKKKGR